MTTIVRDQDEALRFYTEALGLEKRADVPWRGIRWLTVAPKGQKFPEIILAKADKSSLGRVGAAWTEPPVKHRNLHWRIWNACPTECQSLPIPIW